MQTGAQPRPLLSFAALTARLLFAPRAHGWGYRLLALLFEILGKGGVYTEGDWGCAADFKYEEMTEIQRAC